MSILVKNIIFHCDMMYKISNKKKICSLSLHSTSYITQPVGLPQAWIMIMLWVQPALLIATTTESLHWPEYFSLRI